MAPRGSDSILYKNHPGQVLGWGSYDATVEQLHRVVDARGSFALTHACAVVALTVKPPALPVRRFLMPVPEPDFEHVAGKTTTEPTASDRSGAPRIHHVEDLGTGLPIGGRPPRSSRG